jgi:uncharacterized protein (TIGR02246 family)
VPELVHEQPPRRLRVALGEALAQQARGEGEVVVLHPHHRRAGRPRGLLGRGLGEPGVDRPVAQPVLLAELEVLEEHVAERPERRVGEPVVVALDVGLVEPDAAQRVARVVGGHLEAPVGVGRVAVGRPRAPGHPGAAGALERGVERRDEAAGRAAHVGRRAGRVGAGDVLVGLAVGEQDERPLPEVLLEVGHGGPTGGNGCAGVARPGAATAGARPGPPARACRRIAWARPRTQAPGSAGRRRAVSGAAAAAPPAVPVLRPPVPVMRHPRLALPRPARGRRPAARLGSLTLVALAAGCAARGAAPAGPADPAAARAEIAAMMARSAEAWNRGDLDAFMEDYAPGEGTTYIGSRGLLRGPAAIRASYAPRFAPGVRRGALRFENLEVDVLAPGVANAIAYYVLSERTAAGADSTIARGPTSLVMRRDGGRWRIVHDHSS